MRTLEALRILGEITRGQWGLATATQAAHIGIDAALLQDLINEGLLVAIGDDVLQIAAAPEPRHSDIKTAWLALQPELPAWQRLHRTPDGAIVSHHSAALLHGLGDLPIDAIDFTYSDATTHFSAINPMVSLHIADLSSTDITVIDGLPVTTIARTITDLLAEHGDASQLGAILDETLHDGRLDPTHAATALAPFAAQYGLEPGDGAGMLAHLTAHAHHTSAPHPPENENPNPR